MDSGEQPCNPSQHVTPGFHVGLNTFTGLPEVCSSQSEVLQVVTTCAVPRNFWPEPAQPQMLLLLLLLLVVGFGSHSEVSCARVQLQDWGAKGFPEGYLAKVRLSTRAKVAGEGVVLSLRNRCQPFRLFRETRPAPCGGHTSVSGAAGTMHSLSSPILLITNHHKAVTSVKLLQSAMSLGCSRRGVVKR